MQKYSILLVEDDSEAAFFTKEFLQDCGFIVDEFELVTDALARIKVKKYDLLLLDLNLPDFNGFEVLKAIKNTVLLPTIVISAYSDLNIKLQAFKLGALDYMVKPYDLEELEARIWTALGKKSLFLENENTFEVDDNGILFKGEKLTLTQTESKILRILIQNKNNTTSREELASNLSKVSSERSLDYHMKNIRKKLNDNSSDPKYLKTEYGVGYILSF